MLKNMISIKEPKSRAAEAFRTLRTNIQFSSLDNNLKTVLITSSGPGEGKTTIIINLAIAMAQSGKKVLILDCDLRKPTIHKKLGLPNGIGLTNLLIDGKKIEDCLMTTEIPNMYALTSGPMPPNPSELLSSNRMNAILSEFEKFFDIILIDSPPVLAVTDAQILSTLSDGVTLVASYGHSEKNALVKAKDLIDKVGGKVLGVILNKVPEHSEDSYYGKYYGYYGTKE